MLLPEAVRETLVRRYRARRCAWLAGEGQWPLAISLGLPSEQEVQRQPDAVRAWAAAWRQEAGELIWVERHLRSLGTQSLPQKLLFRDASQVAAWIGESPGWQRAHDRYLRLGARWPRFARYFDVLADYPDADIDRLEALLDWLDRNPASNLYPRQLPIAGLDTKWLEPRLSLVADLRGGADAGLRPLPYLVRCAILDEGLRRHVGGLSDVAARLEDLAALDLPAERVYIVENLQTGLAFGDEAGAVVFMGLGYGVGSLARLPWVARARCIYWGDLDTHGFAILDRARASLPGLESALMDEETLLEFRDLWVNEREQNAAAVLPTLSPTEAVVYRGLKEQRWGVNVRLEQERIPWSFAAPRLAGRP
jgi:hypothetical protein